MKYLSLRCSGLIFFFTCFLIIAVELRLIDITTITAYDVFTKTCSLIFFLYFENYLCHPSSRHCATQSIQFCLKKKCTVVPIMCKYLEWTDRKAKICKSIGNSIFNIFFTLRIFLVILHRMEKSLIIIFLFPSFCFYINTIFEFRGSFLCSNW